MTYRAFLSMILVVGVVSIFGCASGPKTRSPSDYEGDDPGECNDRADNDQDGQFDCDDTECAGSPDCGGSGNGDDERTTGNNGSNDDSKSTSSGTSSAADVARRLGREPNFLIGLGNVGTDDDWSQSLAHSLPVTLDLHYEYLVGLPGEGGWTEWNQNAQYPVYIAEADIAKNVTPMVTVYQMAAWGDGNTSVINDSSYMNGYWQAAKTLMEKYGNSINGHPALVHLEPDFWAYVQVESGGNPERMPAVLHSECSHLPNNLSGLGRCWIHLARTYAPKVVIGFHASNWGFNPTEVGQFLLDVGGDESDVVFTDVLDRDAGCFEAAALPQCQRDGEFYWDDDDFKEHLAWISTLHSVMKKPVMWWQVPLGVPSDTPGGTPGHYRDNRVKYIFENVAEFVKVGGLGACFGTGDEGQTDITTDGGQFKDAVTKYYANPTPLP